LQSRDRHTRPLPAPAATGRLVTKGLSVSHPRCILVSSCKHHPSVCDTDRTGAGIMWEPSPCRGWRDAFVDFGGGGWGWARPRGPVGRFSRSRCPGLPAAVVATLRVSITNPGIRTLGECLKNGNWLARRPLMWHLVIGRRPNGGFLSTLLERACPSPSKVIPLVVPSIIHCFIRHHYLEKGD